MIPAHKRLHNYRPGSIKRELNDAFEQMPNGNWYQVPALLKKSGGFVSIPTLRVYIEEVCHYMGRAYNTQQRGTRLYILLSQLRHMREPNQR